MSVCSLILDARYRDCRRSTVQLPSSDGSHEAERPACGPKTAGKHDAAWPADHYQPVPAERTVGLEHGRKQRPPQLPFSTWEQVGNSIAFQLSAWRWGWRFLQGMICACHRHCTVGWGHMFMSSSWETLVGRIYLANDAEGYKLNEFNHMLTY